MLPGEPPNPCPITTLDITWTLAWRKRNESLNGQTDKMKEMMRLAREIEKPHKGYPNQATSISHKLCHDEDEFNNR